MRREGSRDPEAPPDLRRGRRPKEDERVADSYRPASKTTRYKQHDLFRQTSAILQDDISWCAARQLLPGFHTGYLLLGEGETLWEGVVWGHFLLENVLLGPLRSIPAMMSNDPSSKVYTALVSRVLPSPAAAWPVVSICQ